MTEPNVSIPSQLGFGVVIGVIAIAAIVALVWDKIVVMH
jgi:hypothetical protein